MAGSGAVHGEHHVLRAGAAAVPGQRLQVGDGGLPGQPAGQHKHRQSQQLAAQRSHQQLGGEKKIFYREHY